VTVRCVAESSGARKSDVNVVRRVNRKEAAGRRRGNPVRSRPVGAEHRHHLRQQPAGEGTHRTRVWHIAGPDGQEPAPAKAGELRLAQVSSIAAANAWLPGFITAYNTRFGRDPANAKDLHRPLAEADDLDEILARRGRAYGHAQPDPALRPDDADPGSHALGPWLGAQEGGGRELPGRAVRGSVQRSNARFKVFDKIPTVQPGAIVDNKRLSAVLEQVKAQQAAYPARQQRGHIARQRPPNNLEAPGLPPKGRAPRQPCCRGCGLI
jgi:hypothetical protein